MQNQTPNYQDLKNQFDRLVKDAKSIFITSHTSPDDDSISSVLAVYYYLTHDLGLTKPIRIVYTGDYKNELRYSYFENFNLVEVTENSQDQTKPIDLVIMVDVNDIARTTDVEKPRKNRDFNNKFIIIDHHTNEIEKEDLSDLYIDVKISSTAELLYKLFWQNSPEKITKELAEILLLGILGDTGQFRYIEPTDQYKDTLITSDNLIKLGNIKINEFISHYDKKKINTLKVYALLVNHLTIEYVDGWLPLVYSYVENEELKDFTNEEIGSGVAIFRNITAEIAGAEWGFTVKPKPNKSGYSISFRSTAGNVNVREIAEHFGGGGHISAAGALLPETVNSAKEGVDLILDYLRSVK